MIPENMLNFKLEGIVRDLSMMRESYKLTITTTKNWKDWKVIEILKMYNIGNFETFRYKLIALGNIIQSILNHKPIRQVSILRLPND